MLAENLRALRQAVEAAARCAGRDPKEIRLVAVSKTVGVEQVRAAAGLGLTDFGENRLQEALPKVEALPHLCWHFIGHLQTNKVKAVLEHFTLIHSLDRLSLARELQRRAEQMNRTATVLVQVNITGEDSKHGLAPAELVPFLEKLRGFSRINVRGLMTMAPLVADPEETRPVFRQLRRLREEAGKAYGAALPELSMGMTNDFVVAVEEGSTMIRIGTALFGPRDNQ